MKLFQNASGITATGTADPPTLKALYAIGAKKLPSGSDPSTDTDITDAQLEEILAEIEAGMAE